MAKCNIFVALKAKAIDPNGVFGVCFRVGCYASLLLIVMWAATRYFGDTYTANVSLFILVSTIFELLWSHCTHISQNATRLWCYFLCLIGIGLSGALLIGQAMNVQAQGGVSVPLIATDK